MPRLPAEWSRRFAAPVTGRSFGEFAVVQEVETGGGELPTGLAHVLPVGTHATEGWAPNLPVAQPRRVPRAAMGRNLADPAGGLDVEVPGS